MDGTIAFNRSSNGRHAAKIPRGAGAAAIYERIVAAVSEHRLHPGTKLVEERIAAIFAVSRTIVRQALTRLAQDGIVIVRPNRGACVAAPSRREALHVFEARRLIEPPLAARLAREAAPRAIARLRRHVEKEHAARARSDRRALIRLTGEFHLLLATLAGNDVLQRMLRELEAMTCLVILLYDRPGATACLPNEHDTIIDAIEAGDARRAARAMREHLVHVEAGLDLAGRAASGADLTTALSP